MAPSSEHTALAHGATLRSTRKIDGFRSNHTRPALGASVRDKHCGDGSHTARQSRSERFTANKTHVSDTARCTARQHKACPSKHLPPCFAGLPLGLLETCDQHLGDTVPCPNHGHTRWPEAIRPQLDRTGQSCQSSPPSNTRKFDSPLLQKPTSQSRRYCTLTTPVRQTPPVRTHFLSAPRS